MTASTAAFGRNYAYACGEPVDDEVAQVAASSQSTIFLSKSGQVSQVGALHGWLQTTPTPVVIPLPLKCVQVSAGRHFCLGRMEGGLAVVSWGAGHFGQLGVPPTNEAPQVTFTPRPMVLERLLPHVIGSPVESVAAGGWHALALTASGKVWAWGSNRSQQCGRKPSAVTSTAQSPTILVPLPVPFEEPVQQISAGRTHSVALSQGQVYCWGGSSHGQCGHMSRKTGVSPPKRVPGLSDLTLSQAVAGGNHTLALTVGGRVFAWGSNLEGQLGLGCVSPAQPRPRQIHDLDFLAVAAASGRPEELSSIPKIVQLYAGMSYSMAISSSGHCYSWGSNDVGQLGIPISEDLGFQDPTHADTHTRDAEACTFDARHVVLLPRRVEALDHMFVEHMACGDNHMRCFGRIRSEGEAAMAVGRTLYEAQEDRRIQQTKEFLLAKIPDDEVDGNAGKVEAEVTALPTPAVTPDVQATSPIDAQPDVTIREAPSVTDATELETATATETSEVSAAPETSRLDSTDAVVNESPSTDPITLSTIEATAEEILPATQRRRLEPEGQTSRETLDDDKSSLPSSMEEVAPVAPPKKRGVIRRISKKILKRFGGKR